MKTGRLNWRRPDTSETLIFKSEETDIFFNLAFENILINRYPSDSRILFIWQNSNSVIIGRYQNPWQECNLKAMEEDSVVLARRRSGGGAVYHDLGNVCFTLICSKDEFDKQFNYSTVMDALAELGVHSELSGRNDILVDGRKVSGSAFEVTRDKVCHHGTMLLETDLSKVEKYLTPDRRKLNSHSVGSVSSRVRNLNIKPDDFCNALIRKFNRDKAIIKVDKELLLTDAELKNQYGFFRSEEWRFGNTPKFTNVVHTEKNGEIYTLYLDVNKGIIKSVTVYTDSLDTKAAEEFEKSLVGSEYQKLSLSEASSS